MWESYLERKKMENSQMTFLLLFNDQKFGRVHYFAVMVTVMYFLQLFVYES